MSRELDSELQFHIDERVDDLVAEGMAEADARVLARKQFGNVTLHKESAREARVLVWLESCFQDLRYAFRVLRRNQGFSAVCILSLAIGIGATTAVFSFADGLLLRPLPAPRANEVISVGSTGPEKRFGAVSYPDYVDFRNDNHSFEQLAAYTTITAGFRPERDATPVVKLGLAVSANFFPALEIGASLGRTFTAEEDRVPDRDAVVILSYELWQTAFASDSAVVGRTLFLNGSVFTIIGVAPREFTGVDQFVRPAFYVPLMMWPRILNRPVSEVLEDRGFRLLSLKGRLRPGVSLQQASADFAALAKGLEASWPKTNRQVGARVLTELRARIEQSEVEGILAALLGALAATVLLVACANAAGLLLSRAQTRSREIALRLAIGSAQRRLVRQLLTESLLLAFAGGALGLAIAWGGIQFLKRIQVASDLPITATLQLDERALIAALIASLVSALLFGLAPALRSVNPDLAANLKATGSAESAPRRFNVRNLLVAGQVAASLVVLTVAMIVFLRFQKPIVGGEVGFRTDHLLLMTLDLSSTQEDSGKTQRFYEQLVAKAVALPGVASAALTNVVPMDNDLVSVAIVPEGYSLSNNKEAVTVLGSTVDDHYLQTMRVGIVRGRGFLSTDDASAPRVAVINQELANHYWLGRDPIGKRFRLNGAGGPPVEIVGVARTGKYTWIAEGPTEYLYLPLKQNPNRKLTLILESAREPDALAKPVREAVRELDAGLPVYNVQTMQAYVVRQVVGTPTTLLELIGALGLVGILLAAVGLYGLVAYSVSRRTREIGVRMAIGADSGIVTEMVLKQGLGLGLAGIAAGLVASYGVKTVLLANFSDLSTYALAYVILCPALLLVTVVAAWIPARRASQIDPMEALRCE